MTEDFLRAANFVLRLEGEGKVVVDQGGKTKFGISQNAYPNEDIENLTRERALELYYKDYWLRSKADQLPWPTSCIVFDAAVNCGVGGAARLWKEAIETYSRLGLGAVMLLERVELADELQDKNHKKYGDDFEGWINRILELKRLT